MGAKSRVGRPSKRTRRVELRLNADDPLLAALDQEAAARHVSLQQHITDILIARMLHAPPPVPSDDNALDGSAAVADTWM